MVRENGDDLHFWACSEGNTDLGIADYIRYRHSTDGGKSWSGENIALAPTSGSLDGWAVCDPNVIKIGGYWYLAYTGTRNSTGGGYTNHVFVARSTQPHTGYAKWNGSGWGGTPQPLITYTGPPAEWGAGEPSMVVKDGTIYVYYTYDEVGPARTKVATFPATHPNWPAYGTDRGYAIYDRDYAEDQTDVKYIPQVGRFIALAMADRFNPGSYVHVWQSYNGINFAPVALDEVHTNILATAHNLGMSGNTSGHAEMGRKEFISYSYTASGGSWGRWNAWLNPITIGGPSYSPIPVAPDISLEPVMMLLLDG